MDLAIHRATPAEGRRPERRLRTVVIVALAIAIADALLLGPTLSVLLVLFALLYYVPRALVAWGDPSLLKSRFAKAVAALAIGLATIQLLWWDARLGRERATEVIGAVERYRTTTGGYPEELDKLVPAYLPAVPHARLVPPIAWKFLYMPRREGRAPLLMYMVAPPIGMAVYNFEKREWHQMD